jgi:hypothetical protein
MKIKLLLLAVLVSTISVFAQKKEIVFNVVFKDKNIGTIHAVKEVVGTKVSSDLKTNTDAKVLMMSIHVESEVTAVKENGVLVQGTAYRHANRGSDDVHAKVTKVADKTYQAVKNGKTTKIENKVIDVCVVDLYHQEPKGLSAIFSNMYADFLTVKALGAGKYQVTTPDNKDTFYSYQNGQLVLVESNTPLGKVVCKRI